MISTDKVSEKYLSYAYLLTYNNQKTLDMDPRMVK